MKDAIYIHNQTAVLNFSTFYPTTIEDFLSSNAFRTIIRHYLTYLKKHDEDTHFWLTQDEDYRTFIPKMTHFLKLLSVLNLSELNHPILQDLSRLAYVIEDFYSFWRKLQRVSTIKISANSSGQVTNFMDADTRFNNLIISIYRTFQEKIQGYKNRVYRQLQAGTNASMVLRDIRWNVPVGYEALRSIPFVDAMLLRTPLLLHPNGSKRYGSFVYSEFDVSVTRFTNKDEWFCYPAKVGTLLILIYVHFDFSFSGIANANLFELADKEEVSKQSIDGILLFGLKDNTQEATYSYDKVNDIWLAKVPYMDVIEYYGYMKKMVLTMHNAIMMKKDRLPIHGSMINIQFKNKSPIGVVFMGDSGAGKSETIEAMQQLGHTEISSLDVIFDDMGSFFIEDNQLKAQGTEIGAFIRLDDLDKGSPYKTMDRSIFMNPESVNARVVIPITPYHTIIKHHPVHYFFYANNYISKVGVDIARHPQDLKSVFVQGKRMALSTTHEVGLSTTYFANPFGPMQDQKTCDPLIDYYFAALADCQVIVGEVYTGLGLQDGDPDHLSKTAQVLLDLLSRVE